MLVALSMVGEISAIKPRYRAVLVMTADPKQDVLSPLELTVARRHEDITPEECERQKNLRNSAGAQRTLR